MIGIYNKPIYNNKSRTRIKGTFVQNMMPFVTDVLNIEAPETVVHEELCALQNCEIAVAHLSDDDWKQLIKEYSSNGAVRVRVTVDGGSFNKPPAEENEVYKFHLETRAGTLGPEDWKTILSGLSNKKVVDGLINHENPRGLRRFFVHEVKEHISALTILCEGYLAVHAETKDKGINSALELMKWTEFRESERGQKLIRSDLNKKMDAVRQSEWWLNVFEQESFYEDVKEEWKDTTSQEEIPSALNGLLKAIHKRDTVVPPKIVADAYCILVKKK